jgi:hypothetical protein
MTCDKRDIKYREQRPHILKNKFLCYSVLKLLLEYQESLRKRERKIILQTSVTDVHYLNFFTTINYFPKVSRKKLCQTAAVK